MTEPGSAEDRPRSGTIRGMDASEPVTLPAGPFLLRPWREDDVDAAFDALVDPDTTLWNAGWVKTREDAAFWLERRLEWTLAEHASWAVEDADTAVLVGSVSLHSIDRDQNDAEIGYWTVPAARGRGVAARAVDAACRWGFGALPIDRIELCHAVENVASGRVAEKAGFTYEGRLRRSFRYGDGVKHDELLWARLADDPAPLL
jgi:RimJ/RimL family protein N-acetyltransferase